MQRKLTECQLTAVASIWRMRAPAALLALVWTLFCARPAEPKDVLTYHNDNARTGANLNEGVLTPWNVNPMGFGKLFTYPVDGYVYAQPLYKANVLIPSKGPRNVVFVATQHDSVYAFDANGGGLLWQRSFTNPPAVTTVPQADVISGDIVPEIGITGTPVIDGDTNTLYVVVKTKETVGGVAHYVQRLRALDITTGLDKLGSPKLIGDTTIGGPDGGYTDTTTISVSGTGDGSDGTTVRFNALRQNQRPGLTLSCNRVYVGWASHGDNGPYHGWVVGYNKTTLAQEVVFNTTPNRQPFGFDGGGIWMSGAALAADDDCNLYPVTGNGRFDPTLGNYGDTVLKLRTSAGIAVVDFFTPFNQATLEVQDADLGSTGPMLLPDQPGAHQHLLVEAGKEGRIYLIDRDNMGKYQRCGATCDDVVQATPPQTVGIPFDTPAFFFNGMDQLVYYQGASNVLKAFRFNTNTGKFDLTPAAQSDAAFGFPGTTPSISANDEANGLAWTSQVDNFGSGGPATLHAYDASTLNEIYNSNLTGLRDQLGGSVKFTVPTIADGQVFVGTANSVSIFGLFPAAISLPAAPSNLTAIAVSTSQINLSWTNNATNATGIEIMRSTDGGNFNQINTVARDVTMYMDTGLQPSTVYYYRVHATNQVGDSPDSNTAIAKTRILPAVLSLFDICPGSIQLTWTSTADDHYNIERSSDGTSFALIATVDARTTSFTDTQVTFGPYFYRVRAFNADGDSAVSNTVNVTLGPVNIDHSTPPSGGFITHDELFANGSAQFTSENLLRLTSNNFGQAGSAFTVQRVGVRSFTTKFRIRLHDGTQPPADGLTFTIQGNSPTALGPSGGGLGYGPDHSGPGRGIRNSVAVKFDIFQNESETDNSTGLFSDGRAPTIPEPNSGDVNIPLGDCSLPTTNICLKNQNPKDVVLTYDGSTLTETITDVITNKTFTHSYTNVDIPGKVGSDTGFVGFTGGTGGLFALQDVTSWKYNEQEANLPPRAPSNLRITSVDRADATHSNITMSWKCGNAYTAQGFSIERSTDGINFNQIFVVDTDDTSFTDSGLSGGGLAGGTYYYRVRSFNTTQGFSAYSNVDSVLIGGGDNPTIIDHSAGFASHGDLTGNGSTSFVGTAMRLTDGGFGEAGSAFLKNRVSIGNFTTSFKFQIRPGTNPMADGITFTIQGNSPTALGPGGGGLGYGPDFPSAARGIRNSVAVKFDIFDNAGEGTNSTGLFGDGRSPTVPEPNSGDVLVKLDGSGIDLKSTHPFKIDLAYDGTTLTETITDTVTQVSTTQTYPVDIVSMVGGNLAYMGFTGGTGGLSAIQDIQTWTAQSGP